MFNLFGIMNWPLVQACEILFTRTMCVYDELSDVWVVMGIDHRRDPWWLTVCLLLLIIPILLKVVLMSQALRRKGWKFVHLVVLGPFMMAFIDVYLLLAYPWISPTDTDLYGTLERLSPLVETFVEGFGQSSFQLYMYFRITNMPEGSGYKTSGFETVILFSFVPSILNIFYKIFQLKGDANQLDFTLFQYLQELLAGPLGYSAPFLTLLSKKEEVSYESMGPLNERQQKQIFGCLGKQNTTLKELIFDDMNKVDPGKLGAAITENTVLEFVDFGVEACDAFVMSQAFEPLQQVKTRVGAAGQVWDIAARGEFCSFMSGPKIRLERSGAFSELLVSVDLSLAAGGLAPCLLIPEQFGMNACLAGAMQGLVLWLNASIPSTMEMMNDGHDLLTWKSLVGDRTLRRADHCTSHYLPKKHRSLPTVTMKDGWPSSVFFSKDSIGSMGSVSFKWVG